MSRSLRLVPAVLAGVVALAVAAPGAGAADTLGVNGTLSTPTSALTANTTTVMYYLDLRSTTREERFSVRLDPPRFATLGGLDEGDTIDGPRAIALQGGGTLGQRVTDGGFLSPCSATADGYHGYATGATTVDVLLPPNTASTLAVRYRAGRHAPWVDTDGRLTFRVQPQLVGEYPASSPFAAGATVTATAIRRTLGPLPSGRLAAHLLLQTTPAGTVGSIDRAARAVRRRTGLRAKGRVLPAKSRRRVIVQWSRNGGSSHTLATVRTDRHGRFTTPRWRPARAGTYEISARYPKQAGGLTADHTACPVRVRMR